MSAVLADPEVDEKADRITDLQTTVSASRLNCFLSCRLKFYFRYVLRIKKARTPALHVGGAVHAVLKAWNMSRWRKEPLSLRQLHDEYATAWNDQRDEPVNWQPGEEEEEKKVGWRLVETYIRESRIPPDLKPDAVEVPVGADLHDHGLPTLVGVLDLVQAGVIIDYKSASQTPNPERAAHVHEVQTTIYAVLYRENTGKVEAGIEVHTLVKLKTPKLVVSTAPAVTQQQLDRLFRVMESYIHGLDLRDWVPSPGLQCSFCEYFNECRGWLG